MSNHRFVHTETLQLAELQLQDLVDTPLDARFNRLARLAREALRVRVAAISFLDRDREWFKAVVGWNVGALPREKSLANLLLDPQRPTLVADTLKDERCSRHPLVIGTPEFRFCALYPLLDRFDNIFGAVAAYDTQPHPPTPRMLETLSDLGHLTQRELLVTEIGTAQRDLLAKLDASRRHAVLDDLTRLWNRRGGIQLLERAMEGCLDGANLGVCVIDIDRFKAINDRQGHAGGDAVLRKLALILVDSVRSSDVACRLGGDEFLLVFPDISSEQLARIAESIRVAAEGLKIRTAAGTIEPTISLGGVLFGRCRGMTAEDLIHQADEVLYRAKAEGRNRTLLIEGP